MNRYDWNQLIKLWETEDLTVEQVIGQLLLWGQEIAQAQTAQAKTVQTLEQRVESLESGVRSPKSAVRSPESSASAPDSGFPTD